MVVEMEVEVKFEKEWNAWTVLKVVQLYWLVSSHEKSSIFCIYTIFESNHVSFVSKIEEVSYFDKKIPILMGVIITVHIFMITVTFLYIILVLFLLFCILFFTFSLFSP